MKKGLLSIFILSSLFIKAQSDTSAIEITVPTDSTEIGAPDGKSSSKEIGPSGGTIISEDGRIELIFPAGALTEIQTIRIQPTKNHAPNGAGKSYWFEPSGIQFQKPVQLVFHYTDEEAETCPAELMCMGIQSKNGKWSFVEYEEIDTVTKKLKGWIQHFSGGSNVWKLKLEPVKNQLRVKESTTIRLTKYERQFDVEFVPFIPSARPVVWYVNKIEMGNSTVGTITSFIKEHKTIKESIHKANYLAPDFLISNSPVTISAEIYIPTVNRKVYKRLETLRCKIDIYDVYQVTVKFTFEIPGANDTHLTDTSSFLVWLYPKNMVINNIKNYPPYVSRTGKGQCTLIIFTEGYNGHMHLNDAYRNYKLSKDNPPEVFFEFFPMYETSISQIQWLCKKMPPSPKEVLYGTPVSPEINFIANGLTQHINFNRYGTVYKIVVVPYRPEKQ